MFWQLRYIPFVVLLSGCSLWSKASLPPVAPQEIQKSQEEPQEETIPFQLKVHDELNDGTYLYVKASLQGEVQWRPEEVAVKLITIRSGEAKESDVFKISELLPLQERGRLIEPRDEVLFTLQGEGGAISDYQLELLWGEDAKGLVDEKPVEKSFLAIENLTVAANPPVCEVDPCITRFQLQGDLVNKGTTVVDQAEIAVGFLWVPSDSNEDLTGKIPDKEEKILLKDLNLGAGRSRVIKLNFTKAVPSSREGEVVPTVRILDQE